MDSKDITSLDSLNDKIVQSLKMDISDAENYQDAVIFPTVSERYQIYYADKKYYERMMPKLSKVSSFVSTDVADTIEWALPPLMKVFTGGENIVSISGVSPEDEPKADIMQELVKYQMQRQNNSFPIIYNWMKDAFITGLGIVKCYWERQVGATPETVQLNKMALSQLQESGVEITDIQGPDNFGDYTVTYNSPYYIKNNPKIENILINEFLYSPDAKTLKDANFVAHKKIVNMSYLRKMEQQGIYSNIDKIHPNNFSNSYMTDPIKQVISDNYYGPKGQNDEARQEVIIYECYTKFDINGDGILEDIIVTLCDDTIIRLEPNYMGRHPFFDLSPMKDPHRIWAKKSYAEMIGEIQSVKIAIERQIIQNMALTNDPKMIIDPGGINIDDYINGRAVIRKKPGSQMQEVAKSMPVNQIAPYTFNILEYLEGQKEQRTGITRYNQGLDASSLNKMLALDTPIPMADGSYKLNKDIVKGDVLIGSDGKPTTVLKAHPFQMPKRAFKITFETGDVIKAGGEHRWSVKVADKNNRHKSPEWEKLPTERIFDLMQSGHKVWIPRVKDVDFTEKDLPIDPYVFGAWLGDGNAHTNRFTSMDQEVVNAFSSWAGKFYEGKIESCKQQHAGKAITYSIINTPFRKMLKELGVLKDSRYEDTKYNVKHIPEIYLQGSFEQRLSLLRGLMDTDGCITQGGQAIFCNSEPALIDGFVRLLHSFGIKAHASWRTRVNNKFPNARPHAHVSFTAPFCPVTIKYKVQRWRTKDSTRWEQQRIKSIEEIPIEMMRCLTVSAKDELYCCGHVMTLTSNTATGISAILNQSNQRLELIARMFAETGFYELFRFLVSLNQKFIDQNTVIRIANKPLNISPDDLDGKFDLDISSGISISSEQAQMMSLQTILTGVMQMNAAGITVATPTNIYNIMKKWIETAGFKNYADYITDPAIIQQKAVMDMVIKQQVLAQLPPEALSYYLQFGQLPPQVMVNLPPQVQAVFGGDASASARPGSQTQSGQAVQGPGGPSGIGGESGGSQNSPESLVGSVQRGNNQVPQNVPRAGNGPVQEPSSGIGGF